MTLLQGFKACLLGFFLCGISLAKAHELDAAELLIQQHSPGQYSWSWVAKGLHRSALENVAITWPSTCEARKNRLQCPGNGLKGKLSLEGLGASVSLVSVRILDDQGEHRYALTHGQPSVWLQGMTAMPGESGWASHLRVSGTYVALGIEHILAGLDHLLFVISLYLLVGAGLSLIGAITAFTVAHTTSLAASALGWINIPTGPVEACIALSIVLVCAEALRAGNSWTQRAPYLAAFPFGLVGIGKNSTSALGRFCANGPSGVHGLPRSLLEPGKNCGYFLAQCMAPVHEIAGLMVCLHHPPVGVTDQYSRFFLWPCAASRKALVMSPVVVLAK